mgnify:CR=1 FL=1
MPWVSGKHRLTKAHAWFLAGWARRLSWKEVVQAYRTTWDHVFSSVEAANAAQNRRRLGSEVNLRSAGNAITDKAEIKLEENDSAAEQELEIEIEGAPANTELTVILLFGEEAVELAKFTSDDEGEAEVKFESRAGTADTRDLLLLLPKGVT